MSKGRILIVEDERIVAEDIRMCLEDAGYDVCGIAKRGLDAIGLAQEHQPDLALLDIVLRGDMDGIDVASAIRQDGIPFIFLTAYSQQSTLERAKETGPLGYIIKPFDQSTLLSSVEIAIHKSKLDRSLLESHEWFHTTLQSIGDGVIATDPNGLVVFMNPIAEALTGFSSDLASGQPIETVFKIVNDSTGNVVDNPALEALKHNRVVGLAQNTLLLPQGNESQPIPVDDSGSTITDADGHVMGAVLVFRDITEQRAAQLEREQRQEDLEIQIASRTKDLQERVYIEELVSSISADLLDLDDTRISEGIERALERVGSFLKVDHCGVYPNNSQDEEYAWSPPSHQWGPGAPLDLNLSLTDWYRRKLHTEDLLSIDDLSTISKESPETHDILAEQGIHTLACLPFGSQGNTQGALILHAKESRSWLPHEHRYLKVVTQIIRSALRRMEAVAEKERLMEELNQANKLEAIGKLTGGIAHDFNNMLLPIIGYSDMLLDPLRSKEANDDEVTEIRKAAESAAALTKQLLAFSRNQILEKEPLDLRELIQEHRKMLTRILGEDIQLELALTDEGGIVEADRGQMDQVIMNLCVNARDAMPEGGQITIKTALVSHVAPGAQDPNQYLKLTVQDSGVGMDPDVSKRAFDPFFSTKGMEGTGLGLSVVVGIVEQHQGWIDLTTNIGKGTTFDIFLPHLSDTLSDTDSAIVPTAASTERASAHIFLIEDEPAVLAFVKAALEKRGYRITTAKCAKEAYRVFENRTSEFDLIFSDAMLPDGTGMEVLETILGEHPHIPGLLSSGYTDHRAMVDLARANDITFLHKPYALKSLYETVASVIKDHDLVMAN